MINTVKGFSFADETEADVFLEFPCFCYEPVKNRNNDRPHFLGVHIHWGWWLSPEIKRHLLLRRKAMTNLDSILKSKDTTLPTKVYIVKALVFSVVMYGCESWTRNNTRHWRIDAFELWCCRRLLKVPWKQGEQILKEVNPKYSLQGLMLKLKLYYLATCCEELTH